MPNTCTNDSDLIVPAFDATAKTSQLILNIHPGQVRILDYLAASDRLPFVDREDAARFAICYGAHALLIDVPNNYTLLEAKMDIFQDDRFEQQKDSLAVSVHKYLAAGELDNARRLVTASFEEYRGISIPYWRTRWMSTLAPAIEMLRHRGVRLPETIISSSGHKEAL
jgi:hypothetical protein